MFATAYDTTRCGFYIMEKTIAELKKHEAMGGEQFQYLQADNKEVYPPVKLVTPGLATIPPFAHPLVIKADHGDYATVYVDVRSYTRLDLSKKTVVHAHTDYALARNRGTLQSAWMDKTHFVDLLNLGAFPMKMYTRWIVDTFGVRLNLPGDVQQRVTAIVALFYLGLFMPDAHERAKNKETLTESEQLKSGAMVARNTQVMAETVLDVFSVCPIMADMEDLINALKAHSGSQRFENVNKELLITAISGTWFGSAAGEIAGVGVEHPPTFLAMLYAAVNERGFKGSFLQKIAQQYNKTDDIKAFNRAIESLLV